MSVVWRLGSMASALAGLLACEDSGGGSGPDAAMAPRCSATAAFGRPTVLTALNTMDFDEQATLSADELTLYFSRGNMNENYDIYQATRASKTAAFGAAVPVPGVNTAAQERAPRVTADGLTMYATSRALPEAANKFRVVFATRASTDAPFGPLQNVPVVNGTADDSDPFITADGNTLYFASNRGGNYALYRSVKTGGVFSAPALVMGTNLDSTSDDGAPLLSEDGLTLYLASSRIGGKGSVDIFLATRASAQDPFGQPVAVTELNSTDPDIPSWLSADGCELYYTRFTPATGLDLAVALRGK